MRSESYVQSEEGEDLLLHWPGLMCKSSDLDSVQFLACQSTTSPCLHCQDCVLMQSPKFEKKRKRKQEVHLKTGSYCLFEKMRYRPLHFLNFFFWDGILDWLADSVTEKPSTYFMCVCMHVSLRQILMTFSSIVLGRLPGEVS